MPFQRPTLPDLVKRAEGDIEARLPGADARLPASSLGVLARTHAGAIHGLNGFIAWVARQIHPDTAEAELLDRYSGWWGIGRRPAAPSVGSVVFTGANGSVIIAGTLVRRSDGRRYATDAEAVITGGTATVALTAAEPGAAGDLPAGARLTLVSTIAGVATNAVVGPDGLTAGADQESDASLRARLLARMRQPPHGGSAYDYVAWALQVPGVTRAWVFPGELGLGTVTVRVMMDGSYTNGIPLPDDVATVQAHLDDVRPVTAEVVAVAPLPVPLDLAIAGLSPSTQEVRDAVAAEVASLARREGVPGGTILLSHIRAAISLAAGEWDHILLSPLANVTHATGEIPVPGTITWS